MFKSRVIKEYFFKDLDHKEMIEDLNNNFPVNLSYSEDIINRIHLRYPILSKTDISLIVKAVFQSIRDLLFLGKILNFNTLFFDTKLLVFAHRRKGVTFPSVKVKISTPSQFRENNIDCEK